MAWSAFALIVTPLVVAVVAWRYHAQQANSVDVQNPGRSCPRSSHHPPLPAAIQPAVPTVPEPPPEILRLPGVEPFLNPEVAKKLELTPSQMGAFGRLNKTTQEALEDLEKYWESSGRLELAQRRNVLLEAARQEALQRADGSATPAVGSHDTLTVFRRMFPSFSKLRRMTPLTALLLLALGAETKAETHYPGASAVFQCTFESSHDEEIYGWPPGWTRRHGPGFPRYVRVRVDDHAPLRVDSSLRVELDGGAATAYGPAISVNPDVQYVLEGYVETSGLQHDGAYLSLIFLDSARTKLGSIASEKISGSSAWQKIRLGPVLPPAGASFHARRAARGTAGRDAGSPRDGLFRRFVVGATAAHRVDRPAGPRRFPEQEKPGSKLGRWKAVAERSANDATFLLFPRGQPIEIACVVSGFAAPAYEIRLELLDIDGRKMAEHGKVSTNGTHLAPRDERPGGCRAMHWDSIGFAPRSCLSPPIRAHRLPGPQARPQMHLEPN